MIRVLLAIVLAVFLATPSVKAQQQSVWVQIDTQPSLRLAQDSIRRYSASVLDVNGFALGGGWYAVALGPYSPQEAQRVLREFTERGTIPADSSIEASADYGLQFWPIGAEQTDQAALPPDTPVEELQASFEPDIPAETRGQARISESLLSREEKKTLQVALQWAGYYNGAIDAAFGRETRNSMANWQADNGFDATGILTTRQRAELLRRYNAILEGLNVQLVRDDDAGIAIKLPTGTVGFERYEPPFAHYAAGNNTDMRVLLISQEGDATTLAGLYDIMQTLEIVLEAGERRLKGDSFTLVGESADITSYTQASLENGQIKGFTLVWPAGDEERRTRLLNVMKSSFARLDGVLDPAAGTGGEQSIDLVAGLEIRRPRLSRSGIYVDDAGTVVTTTEVIGQCRKLTIDQTHEAEVVAQDAAKGIAVLRPVAPIAPLAFAAFQQNPPRLQSEIAVSGYSYGGILDAPTLTFGQVADIKGLNGDASVKRLALAALDGDAGGPVVDAGGTVLGMLLPAASDGRQLPDGVSFAAKAAAITDMLGQAGVAVSTTADSSHLLAETLTRQASDITALVSCWD